MKFGLMVEAITQIANLISFFPEMHRAIIFGSRAMGNFKSGSDVDIALKDENITPEIVTEINYRLNEETSMPYFLDVAAYDELQNQNLIVHIDQFGKTLFVRRRTDAIHPGG